MFNLSNSNNSYIFDVNSIKEICQNSNQVMVSGRYPCGVDELTDFLNYHPKSPAKIAYDFELGDQNKLHWTTEGRLFTKISYHRDWDLIEDITRQFKAAIVNLMIENLKRQQENLPLIPFIYCFDRDGYDWKLKPRDIAARDQDEKIITNSELRFCYKICCELKSNPLLAPVAKVAEKTLKFVKLEKHGKRYLLKEIDPFWNSPQWTFARFDRESTKVPKLPEQTNSGWRMQLEKIVKDTLKLRVKP